ncbi:MAG: 4a-hydroxytetrahydrobiopterin dehydratase, partial [Hydrogenophaga sp.]
EIVGQLTQLNGESAQGWKLIDGSIEKTYTFPNYHATMAFVNALAWIAHSENHHPDLAVSYSKCTVRWNTHDVDGISVSDMFCAAAVDALVKE